MNFSNETIYDDYSNLSPTLFLGIQIILILLMTLSFWIFISLLIFGIKKKAWSLQKSRATTTLMTAALLCPFMLFLRLIFSQALLNFRRSASHTPEAEKICFIITFMHRSFYAITTTLAYFFLWFRQRILYSKPLLNHLNTRLINTISISLPPIFIIGFVAINIMFFVGHNQVNEHGCTYKFHADLGSTPLYICTIFTTITQIALFALLFRPLLIYHSVSSDLQRKYMGQRLLYLIKLASITAFVSITSDVISLFVAQTIQTTYGMNTLLPGVVFDTNLAINVLSLIFCFEDFSKIIFAFRNLFHRFEAEIKVITTSSSSRPQKPNYSSTNL